MEIVEGKIINYDERKAGFMAFVPYANHERMTLRQYDVIQVGLPDTRTITPKQRRAAYSIMKAIAEWAGELPEYIKRLMKMEFIVGRLEGLRKEVFSLSDCDVTTAREFITYLVDFAIEHDIPMQEPLYNLCDDIERYVYMCLVKKKCAVCGRHADMHHIDAIGIGRDRTTVYQVGMKVISLCRGCHSETHNKGFKWIAERHLIGIPLTREIGKVYGLTKKSGG